MTQSRKQLYFILFVVLIEVIGFGIVVPIFPDLLKEITGAKQNEAAVIGGNLVVIYAAIQLIFAPLAGGLSDRFGRRPLLLLSIFIFIIDYIILALAPTLFWLVIGRILGGVAGSTIGTAHAYVTDISTKENRAKYFGFLGGAMSVGLIIGPAFGGFLGQYDLRLPFWVSAGVMTLSLFLGFRYLPESLDPKNRREFDIKRANPIGALKQITGYPFVVVLLVILCFSEFATLVYPSTWAFYTQFKFGWSISEVAFSLTFLGVFMVAVEAGLIGPMTKAIGNVKTATVGLTISALSLMLYGIATQGWMVYVILMINSIGTVGIIALKTIMANQVPENAQGELQGAITAATSLVAVASPLVMTRIYGFSSDPESTLFMPGLVYVFAASLVFVGLGIFLFTNRKGELYSKDRETS